MTKQSIFKNDKEEHKIIAYFVLRKLVKIMPLKAAKKLTMSLMNSKELLDKFGLGKAEEADKDANRIGIEEANEDIIKKKNYRYKVNAQRLINDILIYLRLKKG